MMLRATGIVLCVSVLLFACGAEEDAAPSAAPVASEPGPIPVAVSPTPPVPSPKPWGVSPQQAKCEGGWERPSPDELDQAVETIQKQSGIKGRFKTQDARTFTGPESPPRDVGPTGLVTRWYVKGGTGRARGRFLVEERQFGRGLVAVAPLDSKGFLSPDWIGFQFNGGTPERVDGLPGRWRGEPYDFVAGGEGLNLPGLPAAVASCLDGS